jgi:hypothetical protein
MLNTILICLLLTLVFNYFINLSLIIILFLLKLFFITLLLTSYLLICLLTE